MHVHVPSKFIKNDCSSHTSLTSCGLDPTPFTPFAGSEFGRFVDDDEDDEEDEEEDDEGERGEVTRCRKQR